MTARQVVNSWKRRGRDWPFPTALLLPEHRLGPKGSWSACAPAAGGRARAAHRTPSWSRYWAACRTTSVPEAKCQGDNRAPLPHHASSLRGGRPTVRGACTFYLLSLSLSLASALSLRPILTAPRGEPGHHLTPHPVNHGLSPLSRKNELDLQSGHGGTHPPRHGPGFAVGTRSAGWGSSQHVCHPCVQAGPTEPGALPPPHLSAPCPPGMPGGAFRG